MSKKHYISFFAAFIIYFGFGAQLIAQSNSNTSLFSDNNKTKRDLNISLIDTSAKKSILNFKQKNHLIGFKSNVNKYFNPLENNTKPKPNFMTDQSKVDDDVLVKKYFNGKDMSNIKLSTDFSLGTFSTSTNTVRIEVRDYSLVDGDRIKIYLNEQLLNANVMLNSLAYSFSVKLKKGYNRIDIEALNEGYSGPNTAEIRVFDEKGNLMSSQEWNISTGERATLGVVKN